MTRTHYALHSVQPCVQHLWYMPLGARGPLWCARCCVRAVLVDGAFVPAPETWS